jgi:hypothetical protein
VDFGGGGFNKAGKQAETAREESGVSACFSGKGRIRETNGTQRENEWE